MTAQNTQQITSNAEKFQTAEQLWFWFIYSKSVRNGFSQTHNITTRRVCEILDVETMITKLYLSGQLTDEHLIVIKKFGDKRRAPHQYIWKENRAAALWNQAMGIIGAEAFARGWLEK